MRGRLDARAEPSTLELRRAIACTDLRPSPILAPEISDVLVVARPIAPGETFDVSAAVAGETGVYTATLLPTAATVFPYYAAFSRALAVR
jgi:hypothetical protein